MTPISEWLENLGVSLGSFWLYQNAREISGFIEVSLIILIIATLVTISYRVRKYFFQLKPNTLVVKRWGGYLSDYNVGSFMVGRTIYDGKYVLWICKGEFHPLSGDMTLDESFTPSKIPERVTNQLDYVGFVFELYLRNYFSSIGKSME